MILHLKDQSVSIIFMEMPHILMPSSSVNIVIKSEVRKCTFPPNTVYKSRQMEVDLCRELRKANRPFGSITSIGGAEQEST